MSKMKHAEAELAEETVVLLVPAKERPCVARALLAAAAEAGADPYVVRTTSDGFAVPRHVAVLADMVLADDQPAPAEQPAEAPAGAEADDALDDAPRRGARKGAGK